LDGTLSSKLWQQEKFGLFLPVTDQKIRTATSVFRVLPFFDCKACPSCPVAFQAPTRNRKLHVLRDPGSGAGRGARRGRNRRDTEALSTLPNKVDISPAWKQEVNQRIAAHRDRKTSSAAEPQEIFEVHHSAGSRAAAAAARVAARFAKAPSYSEMAGEARAAVRAAEAASKAALEAQAAAESVLAGIEAASQAPPEWELRAEEMDEIEPALKSIAANRKGLALRQPVEEQARESKEFEIRWEPDMPVQPADAAAVRATLGDETPEPVEESWVDEPWPTPPGTDSDRIEIVEPGLPIHANLIEFPREIVATRKVRPRLAEGAYGAPGSQLSIFEVDPGSISVEPSAAATEDQGTAPSWNGPEWSGIELDAQPRREFLEQTPAESLTEQELELEQALERDQGVEIAPMSLRLMAGVVNSSLVIGVFLVAAMVVVSHMKVLPSLRGMEVASAAVLAVITVLYHGLFYAFTKGTPGMRYAGVSLCTFDGNEPTRAQRLGRLAAMLLSVVPIGLGVMWAIFDEDRLSWHDRLSQTYLRW